MSFKKLSEVLTAPDDNNEIYINDRKWRNKRRGRGQYSRNEDIFDFIYLIQAWEEIVGKMLATNTRPLKINNHVLFIIVKHPIFSQELQFMTQMILSKIVERFPKLSGHIRQVKFINSEAFFKPIENEAEKRKNIAPKLHPFSPEAQIKKYHASKLFEDIEDESLKELFVDLYLDK